jgi:hypothetical protein
LKHGAVSAAHRESVSGAVAWRVLKKLVGFLRVAFVCMHRDACSRRLRHAGSALAADHGRHVARGPPRILRQPRRSDSPSRYPRGTESPLQRSLRTCAVHARFDRCATRRPLPGRAGDLQQPEPAPRRRTNASYAAARARLAYGGCRE